MCGAISSNSVGIYAMLQSAHMCSSLIIIKLVVIMMGVSLVIVAITMVETSFNNIAASYALPRFFLTIGFQ